jgi:CRP-like cAMP-binding protein
MDALHLIRSYLAGFTLITDEDWKLFTDRAAYQTFSKGEIIHPSGEVCGSIYFLLSGVVKHSFHQSGKQFTIWFSLQGGLMTEIRSFVLRIPSSHSLIALTDAETFYLTHEQLQNLYQVSKGWERIGRLTAEAYLLQHMDRIQDLQFCNAEERYQKLIERSPHLLQQISMGEIASYLGVSQEHLSRIRGKR